MNQEISDNCFELNSIKNTNRNSLLDYISKSRKNRIKWETKLYRIDYDKKILHEQIDNLIDVAAKEFCIWLNGMSNDHNEYKPKTVKELFSIDVDSEICRSVEIDMKHRPAIHKSITEYFQCPEVSFIAKILTFNFEMISVSLQASLENVIEKVITKNEKIIKRKLKQNFISAKIPHDIQSSAIIFSGIENIK